MKRTRYNALELNIKKNMNIIIPIGGLGERFKKENYSIPKPLIKSLGRPIINWVIDSLNIKNEDKLFIVYNSTLEDYNFSNYLEHTQPNLNINFIDISFNTRGAAETVLESINKMDDKELSNLTMIVDSDSFYDEDLVTTAKDYNENLIFYFIDKNEKPIYSYLKLNDNIVLDIEEKNKISDNACVGAYVFKSGIILKKHIMSVIQKNIKTNSKEFYMSTVYKDMLNSGEKILSHKIDGFNCLGTPAQLKSLSSNLNISKKYRFCFDLDNTLVSYPKIKGDYSSVKPIEKNIEFLKNLHQNGHHIIIHTARRMRTHKGNVGRVISDIGRVTFETLDKFDIPYDELYFGKPYADFYIDDLAINAFSDLEKETGFYDIHPKPRSHNDIKITDSRVVKTSNLIYGEMYWYKNIPKEVSDLFPKLIDCSENTITIERIKGMPMSSIYTNKTINKEILIKILNKLHEVHVLGHNRDITTNIYGNYVNKLEKRVSSYDFSMFKDFDETYQDILNSLKNYENKNLGIVGVIHGDPVFSNILVDVDDNIKFIDMRGSIDGELTIYGDIFYDYAKIYQSIIGYDFILMNKTLDVNLIKEYKEFYESYIIKKFGLNQMKQIKNITKSLLLTLIPLHDDEKVSKYFDLIKTI